MKLSRGTLTSARPVTDSGIVMVGGKFFGDSFEQDQSWDNSGTTISGIWGTHQNSIGVRMPVLIAVPRVNNNLDPFLM